MRYVTPLKFGPENLFGPKHGRRNVTPLKFGVEKKSNPKSFFLIFP